MDEPLHARVSSGVARTRFVRHRHMSASDKDIRGAASHSMCADSADKPIH